MKHKSTEETIFKQDPDLDDNQTPKQDSWEGF